MMSDDVSDEDRPQHTTLVHVILIVWNTFCDPGPPYLLILNENGL